MREGGGGKNIKNHEKRTQRVLSLLGRGPEDIGRKTNREATISYEAKKCLGKVISFTGRERMLRNWDENGFAHLFSLNDASEKRVTAILEGLPIVNLGTPFAFSITSSSVSQVNISSDYLKSQKTEGHMKNRQDRAERSDLLLI